tara:strand:+ start:10488 stop:10796 length:309 start_codon:yes stop_codon:yes gene_type:complete
LGIINTLNELGIGLVAYSPMDRGFLSRSIQYPDDFADDDFGKQIPKYQGAQFFQNLDLVNEIKKMATKKKQYCGTTEHCLDYCPRTFAYPGHKTRKILRRKY